MNGLLKLMFPDGAADLPDDAVEWAARLALECRRRVKEQQKRLVPTEYRNTQFSYHMNDEGVEKFVGTPELHQENSIGDDPLPPGQVWVMSPGSTDEAPGLFRIDVTVGPGSAVKLLNQPAPPALKESVRCAEQNMYARSKELVGIGIRVRMNSACKPGRLVITNRVLERGWAPCWLCVRGYWRRTSRVVLWW